jgi:hypothetical protein
MPTIDNFSPIDTSQIRNQQMHNPMATSTSFESILGAVGEGMNLAGPVADTALRQYGQNKGAAFTSAAIMGFNGGGGGGYSTPGFTGSWGPTPGMSKNLGAMPPPPPGFGGGGASPMGAGMPPPPGMGGMAGPGMGQDVAGFDSQINAMMNNNLVFLSLQTKVQNVSQTTQMMSNIHKTDSDAKLNAIRNMRA